MPARLWSAPPIIPSSESPGHQAGPVHQVAQDQPVPDADNEAGPELERPVLERRERVGERAFLPARVFLPQRNDGKHGEDADEDETHSMMRAAT